jgi:peptide/nickel transport system substrate-binding protein
MILYLEVSSNKIGILQQLNGEFMFEFGNSSYDNNIRSLIYGYSTVISDPNGQLVLDSTVVSNLSEALGAERTVGEGEDARTVQDKTFTFTLNSNLKWNDGTFVTADDYIFTLLWNASSQFAGAGASTTLGEFLVGYADYSGAEDATAVYFKGVKKLSDNVFSLTVDGENLPYFYELSTVLVTPYPMHVFAPQASIISDANGSKLSANAFDNLNTILGPNGYRFNPAVTCGPYKFVSFKNQVVVLQKNLLFAGDYTGQKPSIDNIIVKWINQDTDVDQVIAGAVDLVSGVIEGSKIEAAKESATVNPVSYLRNGYGQISFATDFGPTKDINVRTALAYLLNRQEFLTTILEGYGAVVNGEYGLSQWMYQEKQSEVESKLVNYTLNPAKANEYLDKTEYKFEKDGVTPFNASKATVGSGYYRYNAQKQVLQINHFGTTQNKVTDLIETQWKANTQLAGIKFTIEKGGFDALLTNYYFGYELKPEERKFHSFNLATGFTAIYDPYYSYHTDFLNTWMNSNQLSDPALDQLMESMRQLRPDQTEEFADIWLQYQIRWNQLLPNIPLYSNEYFDVVSKRVTGYEVTSLWEWGYALVYADVQ